MKDFVREEGVSPDILGFAGHTICHRPSEHYTHQIGDGRRLAELTGIKTAARFRSADILAGGQGAPFAPVYYEALTAKMRRPLAVIDVGGTSEVVWFGTSGEMKAFVSGPGNAVINDWVMKHGGMHIDYNGRLAITGRVDEKILAVLMHHKYIALNPPKACDRTVLPRRWNIWKDCRWKTARQRRRRLWRNRLPIRWRFTCRNRRKKRLSAAAAPKTRP